MRAVYWAARGIRRFCSSRHGFAGTAIDARERPPKGFEGFRYKPIFGKPETDIWALLIEKAFAKMIGSYPRLDGGHMLNAFRALTGCEEQEMWRPYDVGGSREWRNSLVVRGDLHARAHRGSARLQSPAFFGALESWSSSKYLIAASIRGRRREGRRRDGLVETHAYGVLACMQVGHVARRGVRPPSARAEDTTAGARAAAEPLGRPRVEGLLVQGLQGVVEAPRGGRGARHEEQAHGRDVLHVLFGF